MAAAAGVEPATCSLGESRSIQLSYATAFRISSKQAQAKNTCETTEETNRFVSAEGISPLQRKYSTA